MRVRDVLAHKGGSVVTVRPHATCRDLLALLAQHNIGAVVVSEDGITVGGIVSERDIVRRLHDRGADVLDAPVAQIATLQVRTCDPEDSLDEVRQTMTVRRFRHVPVVSNGRLVGIVSIGDVVKSTISQLEDEKQHLIDYLQG